MDSFKLTGYSEQQEDVNLVNARSWIPVKTAVLVTNWHTILSVFSCTKLSEILSSSWHKIRK